MVDVPGSWRGYALRWLFSGLAGALCLWLASRYLELWPGSLEVARPHLLWMAVVLYVPYAIVRAHRLAFLFDPLIASAGGRALDRSLLYGSGWVSFLILLVVPLKLGELSRPVLLARGRQPGLALTESIAGVATERLIDGVIICLLLFGGLALEPSRLAGFDLQRVRMGGALALGGFSVALVLVGACARHRTLISRWLTRTATTRPRERLAGWVERIGSTAQGAFEGRAAASIWGASVVYWGITVVQLWLVLAACGLQTSLAAAGAIVAIVGLAIQVPGGPGQSGTFQLGTGLALALFFDERSVAGPGSTFAAWMYLISLVGAGTMVLPGLALLARARRAADAAQRRE